MPGDTTIEWTHIVMPDGRTFRGRTWNAITGCTKVSPGCDHCYAETFAERFRGVPRHPFEQGFDLKLWPERLELPLRWRQPCGIFVVSMGDPFHQDVPDDFLVQMFSVMVQADWHIFQVLTKRPQRAARLVARGVLPLAPHIWMGTSVESNAYGWRVAHLMRIPAAVRFISFEPLLGPCDQVELADWAITGGESGRGHRAFDPAWARDIRDRCAQAGVAYFHKQNGGATSKAGGRLLDGQEYMQYPTPRPERLREREAVGA